MDISGSIAKPQSHLQQRTEGTVGTRFCLGESEAQTDGANNRVERE